MLIKFLLLTLLANTTLAGEVLWGDKVNVGRGSARAYVERGMKGEILELGVALTPNALKGLGHEMQMYQLAMPQLTPRPYNHILLDWMPHGHEPDNVYGAPHFDFHFYFISSEQRQAISCMGEDALICTKEISPEYLANNYVPTPEGVPQMGWHWVDILSDEFNGKPFTRTYIYGYYDGKPIFIEPMITLSYLQSRASATQNIRLPQAFSMPGLYPSSYEVSFDKKNNLHKITLKNFRVFE